MRFACSIIIERRFCSSSSCLYRVGKLLAIPSDFVFIYFDNNGNNIGVKRKKKESKSLRPSLHFGRVPFASATLQRTPITYSSLFIRQEGATS